MKSFMSLFLVVISVVLVVQQTQAKKGCNAYGHACYGGHGKRSLGSLMDDGDKAAATQQHDRRPDALIQVFPNEESVLPDNDIDLYPRYRLIKIMNSWFGDRSRRLSDRLNEIDYAISGEIFDQDNNNALN